MKWWATYTNLQLNAIVRLPHPRGGDSQDEETFLSPSADKQTHNYDTHTYQFNVSVINPQSLIDFLFVLHVGCDKYQYKEKRGNLPCLPCGENSSSLENGYRFCSCKKQHSRAKVEMKNSSADCYSECHLFWHFYQVHEFSYKLESHSAYFEVVNLSFCVYCWSIISRMYFQKLKLLFLTAKNLIFKSSWLPLRNTFLAMMHKQKLIQSLSGYPDNYTLEHLAIALPKYYQALFSLY